MDKRHTVSRIASRLKGTSLRPEPQLQDYTTLAVAVRKLQNRVGAVAEHDTKMYTKSIIGTGGYTKSHAIPDKS